MKKYLLFWILVLGTLKSNGQRIYGAALSRVQATGSLKVTPYNYATLCSFIADTKAANDLPNTLKFNIIRKSDKNLVRTFIANKKIKLNTGYFNNSCPLPNTPSKFDFSEVEYYFEQVILPSEFNDKDGYYIITDKTIKRNSTENIVDSDLILYHWFSPKYLFDFANDGDNGKSILSNYPEILRFGCSTKDNSFGNSVIISPGQKIVNSGTLKIIERAFTPITSENSFFKKVTYKSGYKETLPGTNIVSSDTHEFSFGNASISDLFRTSSSFYYFRSPQNGVFVHGFLTEQYNGSEKLCENTMECQFEIASCIFTPYYSPTVSKVNDKTQLLSTIVCRGNSVQVNATGNATVSNIDFQWYKNDILLAGENKSILIVSESGTYKCTYKVIGACNGQSNSIDIVFTNCQDTADISIKGNTLNSTNSNLGGLGDTWYNILRLNSLYYIGINDFHKLPQSIDAKIYDKRSNTQIETAKLTLDLGITNLILYPKVCGTSKDTILLVGYSGFTKLNKNNYPNSNIDYYAITSPICCRPESENLPKSVVVTQAEFVGADVIPLRARANVDFLLKVIGPSKLDACIGKSISIDFIVFNKANIAAKFIELVDVIEGGSPYKKVNFKSGFNAVNFAGNNQSIKLVQDGNSFSLQGIPQKLGTYTYRARFDGVMEGTAISSIFCEFQINIRDCGKPLQPTIFVSKVDKPTIQSPTSICQDSTLQLNLRNFSKGSTFTWQQNNVEIPNEKDSILVIKNSQGGNYTCVAYQPQLCPEKMTTTPTKITFYPKPTVNITASSPTGTPCQGAIVKLMGSSDIANVKYQWFRENVIVNNATNSIFDATESGNYTLKVTSPDECVNISSPQNVVSNTPPKAEITTSNKVVCKGKDVVISATSGTGNIYVWTRDGVTLSNNSDSFTTNQPGKYTVKITAPNTCSSVSKPFELMQVDNPTVNIVNPNGTQLCQGSSTTFTLKGNALSGFQWFKDGVKLTTETKNSLSISQDGEYSVTVIDTNRCENTSVVEKITLVNKVIVKLDSIPSLCGINNPTIILTGTPSGGIFSGNGVNGNEFKSSVSGIGKHKITYTINGSLGCLNGTADREIIVASMPTVTLINPNNSKICVGDKVTISPNIQNGNVFQWFKDNSVIAGANQNTYQTSDAGEYRIEVSNVNNCKAISDNFKVEIFPKMTVLLDSIQSFCGTSFSAIPLIGSPNGGIFIGKGVSGNNFDPKNAGVGMHTITYKITRDPVCAGGEATRKVIITPPPILNLGLDRDIFKGQSIKLNGDLGNGYSYQWNPPTDLDNPLIPKPNAKPSQTTTYVLKATGPNNCVAVDTITLSVVNVIYVPNIFTPNNDGLNDTWDIRGLETYSKVEVSIFNRWGNIVYYSKGNTQKPFDGKFQDQLLPEGTYAYVINTNNGGYVLKGAILLQR